MQDVALEFEDIVGGDVLSAPEGCLERIEYLHRRPLGGRSLGGLKSKTKDITLSAAPFYCECELFTAVTQHGNCPSQTVEYEGARRRHCCLDDDEKNRRLSCGRHRMFRGKQ